MLNKKWYQETNWIIKSLTDVYLWQYVLSPQEVSKVYRIHIDPGNYVNANNIKFNTKIECRYNYIWNNWLMEKTS